MRSVDTGDGLAAATIQIAGTYRGTIANDRGEYLLKVPQLPAILRVTYIGYASQEKTIADTSTTEVNFDLEVSPHRMPEMVVRPDEAARIMAEVIRRKQEWRPRIERYQADAYSRYVVENATDIVQMGEVVSQIYWDQEQGRSEVVVSRRVTENANEDGNQVFSAMEGFVNLYDDDLPLIEHRLIGPTHPNALDHYHFQLEGRRLVDDQVVFDISVRPKSRLQMAYVGRVAVLDGEFGLLEVQLEPSRSALASVLPIPLIERLEVSFQQQFRQFAGGVWLPVDYRMEGAFEIGMVGLQFPVIKLSMVTRLTEYQVNVELPATLFASGERLRVDTLAVEADTAFTRFTDPIPLTPREQEAYATIDSSFTPEDAFRPTGFLTRFMDLDDDEEDEGGHEGGGSVTISAGASSDGEAGVNVEVQSAENAAADSAKTGPDWRRHRPKLDWRLGYNRVAEAYLGVELTKDLPPRVRLRGQAGYNTGLERWSSHGRAIWGWGQHRRSSVALSYGRGVATRFGSDTYPLFVSAIQAAAGIDDYFDYYWSEKLETSVEYVRLRPRARFRIAVSQDTADSLDASTDRDLFRRRGRFRPNPGIAAGRMREIAVNLSVGGDYVPFGAGANRRAEVRIDHSGDWMGSDFSFTRYQLALDWHLKTFWRRRWVPNALDLHLVAGTFTGDLPPQRFGAVDVAMGPLSPFGVLRSTHGHPYEGDRYAALFWEHNFKTVPLEFLGLWPLVQRGVGLVIHGAAARTWMEPEWRDELPFAPRVTDVIVHEIGASLLAYHIFRLDLTRRLDTPEWRVGVGIARFDFD